MKAIKKLPRPEYISCCCAGRFTVEQKKDRFKTKYVYHLLNHIVVTYVQDNGKEMEDEMFGEWFLN